MQKKLLVLNGSHSDIPLIQAGKALGYYVITTGNQPGLIGHKYADEYVCADYSDYKAVTEIAKEKKIDAVCACANDFGAITAAYVAEQLGLPGHDSFETMLTLHHKDRFKRLAKEHHLRTPLAESFTDEKSAREYALSLDYPIIVKPIDLTGGKGISKAFTPEEKIRSIRVALDRSPRKCIVIERFITGTYHSFSTFIVDKKVAFSFSDNEYSFASPYFVSTSAGPATGIEKVKSILIEESEKVARILNLVDGRLHTQYVMDEQGQPHVLEMTRRCSGDVYSYPAMRALGINTPEWIVKAECGISCKDYPRGVEQTGFVGRHCVMAPRNGRIKDIHIAEELEQHVYDRIMWWEPGYEITNYLLDKAGILFYSFDSQEQMLDIVNRMTSLISVEFCD